MAGCDEAVHAGWLDIEVDSERDARGVIPPPMRDQARVVEVWRLTANEVMDLPFVPVANSSYPFQNASINRVRRIS